MELQVYGNVKAAYLALAQARENVALNDQQQRSYERILQIAKRRYETGAIPQVDLLNAQVTLYSNANDLSDMKAAEITALAQLNVLIGEPAYKQWQLEPFKANKRKLPSLLEAETKMLNSRNEIKAAELQLSSADNAFIWQKCRFCPISSSRRE